MFKDELLSYIMAQREQIRDTMKQNAVMGREDFYTLGRMATLEQIIHYINVRGDSDV
jgi:hypothetical protein